MPKPRIALIHYAGPPTIGGVESTMATHARLLADRGYAVRLIAGRGEAFDPRIPVEIVSLAGSQAPRVLEINAELAQGQVTQDFESVKRELGLSLERALAGCDLVIAHNLLSLHKNLALTHALKEYASARGLRIIAWCHDFAWSDPQYLNDLHEGQVWQALREPWPGVTYVVVSQARADELRTLWGNRSGLVPIHVVPPGIDPLEFLGATQQTAQWVRRLRLLRAAPLLLLPARLTRRKNVEFAIEVTGALRRRGLEAMLVVTGPPGPHNPTNASYLEQLRQLRTSLDLDSSVIFLHEYGHVHGPSLRDLYLLADALLFPSIREGFGIPVLEAGLARLPVFCSDLEPFRESAGGDAHMIAPGATADSVAEQMVVFFSSDHAYRLKRRVLETYAWDNIFSGLIEPLITGGIVHAE